MLMNKSSYDRFIRPFHGQTGSRGTMAVCLATKTDEKQLPGRIGNLRSKH